jgi:hypothetical protein
MFALSESDLRRRILGCADGPASFNAEMARRGHTAISCDPLYQLSASQIRTRIEETYDNVIGQTRSNKDLFVWTKITSIEELGRLRLAAMEDFLSDFDLGKRQERYVVGELPDLPFAADSFDLAVCSHYLFLYSPILSLEFHEAAISAMLRLAPEARVFPVLTYDGTLSPYVKPMLDTFTGNAREASIVEVDYEFQRGGNQMMRIRRLPV